MELSTLVKIIILIIVALLILYFSLVIVGSDIKDLISKIEVYIPWYQGF